MTNNLRVERAILRMTQQQLAEAVGVSRQQGGGGSIQFGGRGLMMNEEKPARLMG